MSTPLKKTEYQQGYDEGFRSGKSTGEFIGMLWFIALAVVFLLIVDAFR